MTLGPYNWLYLNSGKRQHAVRPDDLTELMQSAICGTQVLALLPAAARWLDDSDGLAAREKCKQCTVLLERDNHV
jgi:hypothetical protein